MLCVNLIHSDGSHKCDTSPQPSAAEVAAAKLRHTQPKLFSNGVIAPSIQAVCLDKSDRCGSSPAVPPLPDGARLLWSHSSSWQPPPRRRRNRFRYVVFFYLKLSRPQLFVCKTCFNWLIKRVEQRSSSIFSKQYSALSRVQFEILTAR